MMTVALTPEQRQAVEQAGGQPVRFEDPENHRHYILLDEEKYQRFQRLGEMQRETRFEISDDVRRSQETFLRDLPELLRDESLRGKWVAYHGDERIGVVPSDEPLIQECLRRGLKSDQYDLFIIDETEEVTFPSSWL